MRPDFYHFGAEPCPDPSAEHNRSKPMSPIQKVIAVMLGAVVILLVVAPDLVDLRF